ncbi:hypothetical protein IWW37_005675 [Coemansia sp. RSA 2050]|nr:hypothetical protein IWW37_005675 [Coemansia sp. RSA 2050]
MSYDLSSECGAEYLEYLHKDSIEGDMEQHLEPRLKRAQSRNDKENDSIASRTRSRGGRTASTLALGPSTKHASSSGKGLSQRVSKLSILPKEPEQPAAKGKCRLLLPGSWYTAETVKEFVTVICDAMECHNAIVKRCQILHRDISDNNILVVRENGTVRGLLIDFDYAIDLSKEKKDARNEMAGTLPFMSLNNITNSSVKRTSLDDCESMLYLLCWHATIGFGSKEERDRAKAGFGEKAITRWQNGSMETIAGDKCIYLGSYSNFMRGIVFKFDRVAMFSKQLARLALDLYKALFANANLGVEYHGTMEVEGNSFLTALLRRRAQSTVTDDNSPNNASPFEIRSREWENISRDFLDILVRTKNEMVDWVDMRN